VGGIGAPQNAAPTELSGAGLEHRRRGIYHKYYGYTGQVLDTATEIGQNHPAYHPYPARHQFFGQRLDYQLRHGCVFTRDIGTLGLMIHDSCEIQRKVRTMCLATIKIRGGDN